MHQSIYDTIKNCNYFEITDLCKIMHHHGSDKSNFHTYTRLYNELFKDLRDSNIKLFEVGIGSKNINIPSNMCGFSFAKPGGSLRGWKEWFRNGEIYGADIDKDILFTEDRIKCFYTDQLDPDTIQQTWAEIGEDVQFDIMIDDGLHTFEANDTFIKNAIHKLRPGGLYVVEDVMFVDIPKFEANLEEYSKLFSEVRLITVPGAFHLDNTLLIMRKA